MRRKGFTLIEIMVAMAISGIILSVVIRFVVFGVRALEATAKARYVEHEVDNFLKNLEEDIAYWGVGTVFNCSSNRINLGQSGVSFCSYYYNAGNIYFEYDIAGSDPLFVNHPKYTQGTDYTTVILSGVDSTDFKIEFYDKDTGDKLPYNDDLAADTGVVYIEVTKDYLDGSGSYTASKRIVTYSEGANNVIYLGYWGGAEDIPFDYTQNGKRYLYTDPHEFDITWDDTFVPELFNTADINDPFSAGVYSNRMDVSHNVYYDNDLDQDGWGVTGNNDDFCRYIGIMEPVANCPTYAVFVYPEPFDTNDNMFFCVNVGHPDQTGNNPYNLGSTIINRINWPLSGVPLSVSSCNYDINDYNIGVRLENTSDISKACGFTNEGSSGRILHNRAGVAGPGVFSNNFIVGTFKSTLANGYIDIDNYLKGTSYGQVNVDTGSPSHNFILEINASTVSSNLNVNNQFDIKSYWIRMFNLCLNRGLCWGIFVDGEIYLNKVDTGLTRDIGGGKVEYVMAKYISPIVTAPSGKNIIRAEVEQVYIGTENVTMVSTPVFSKTPTESHKTDDVEVFLFNPTPTIDFTIEVCQQQQNAGDPIDFDFDWSLNKVKFVFE